MDDVSGSSSKLIWATVGLSGWTIGIVLGTLAFALPGIGQECRSDVCPGPSSAEQSAMQWIVYLWLAALPAFLAAVGLRSWPILSLVAVVILTLGGAVVVAGIGGSEPFGAWPLFLPGIVCMATGALASADVARRDRPHRT